MAKSKLVAANKKVEEKVVGAYHAIENGVVGTYQKIENGAVGLYQKIEDRFVDHFLTEDGETVEQAKERISAKKGKKK